MLSLLKRLANWLWRYLQTLADPPPAPRQPSILVKREVWKMQKQYFGYTLKTPVATFPDIVSYNTHVSINDVPAPDVNSPLTSSVAEIVAQVNDKVSVAFSFVDLSGNISPKSIPLSFVAIDDVPPPAPGAPEVISHREFFVDVPDAPEVPDAPSEPTA